MTVKTFRSLESERRTNKRETKFDENQKIFFVEGNKVKICYAGAKYLKKDSQINRRIDGHSYRDAWV